MDLSKNSKIIISVVTLVGTVFGAAIFLEDRYEKVAAAREMRVQLEKESVETFKQQQEYTDTRILDILLDQLKDMERRLEKNPTSIYLKNQLERIKDKIRRLEDKLFK